MALGPDPNRTTESDPELRKMGDPPSTRLGLSSSFIVLLVVLIALAVVAVVVF